jgi:hypothetical protein
MLLLGLLSPILVPGDDGSVLAQPSLHPGKPLVVDNFYSVGSYEVWGDVIVGSTGTLSVTDGAHLVAESITLQGNSIFEVAGAVIDITNNSHRDRVGIWGRCNSFEVSQNSLIRIEGPDGAYDIPTSQGCSVGLDVTAARLMLVEGSNIELSAGHGLSVPETLTRSDLDGHKFAGGDVTLKLVLDESMGTIRIIESTIVASAGDGGDAPDGLPPPAWKDNSKGLGGGFTRGGDVAGNVGTGGAIDVLLNAGKVELSAAFFHLTSGEGGDAGDAADLKYGPQAGGGGGGYTGGDGASGISETDEATPGGMVSGAVGAGGDISVAVRAADVAVRNCLLELTGGNGGDAGDGGRTEARGGAGGGGYSGGGGGSYWHLPGASGGTVTGEVGSGGDITATLEANDKMTLSNLVVQAWGGHGGDGGNGGDVGTYGGAGGGGYSGGGGGGEGGAAGGSQGNPGGHGGAVADQVAQGGDAILNLHGDRLIMQHSSLTVAAGHGGEGGYSGTHVSGDYDEAAAGAGAGGQSAGGGGGNGNEGQPDGLGGRGGMVVGRVCHGGDASLDINSSDPSIHRDTLLVLYEGSGGLSYNVSAYGGDGGRSSGQRAQRGIRYESIPMSKPILWEPAQGSRTSIPPVFQWMPLFRSTDNGQVVEYIIDVDDSPDFDDPDRTNVTFNDHITFPDLPMGTYSWRVTPVYQRPAGVRGPTSEAHQFKFYNSPPRILVNPTVHVDERVPTSIPISNYVTDPDDGISELLLGCNSPHVTSIMGLYMMVYYPQWIPDHVITYNVTDGISTVEGKLYMKVIDINENPTITSIGGKHPPIIIEMEENSVAQLRVIAEDPDGDPLTYEVMEDDLGATMSTLGMLTLSAGSGDLGDHRFTVIVEDGRGGKAGAKLRVVVVNAREPPDPPEIFGPKNHSKYKEGKAITFTVKVSDPDIEHGEVLNVEWTSNRSGIIGSVATKDMAHLTTDRLPVGSHRIFITVDDGTYAQHAWLDIEVVPGPPPSTPPTRSNTGIYILGALMFALMLGVGYWAGKRGSQEVWEVVE